jgi:hypothetical protein
MEVSSWVYLKTSFSEISFGACICIWEMEAGSDCLRQLWENKPRETEYGMQLWTVQRLVHQCPAPCDNMSKYGFAKIAPVCMWSEFTSVSQYLLFLATALTVLTKLTKLPVSLHVHRGKPHLRCASLSVSETMNQAPITVVPWRGTWALTWWWYVACVLSYYDVI